MFREHNYTQGRWVSPDPAGMGAAGPTNPQSWNRYAYVGNTPLSSIDADGLVTLPGCEEGDFSCGLGGGVGGGCGELGGPEGDICTLLLPPIWIWGGGGMGNGGSGGGGGVGTGGSGGGGSEGGSSSPISFPNGENLGLPAGYNFKPLNIFQLLGLEPIGTDCEFGACVSMGNGFASGVMETVHLILHSR